MTEAEAIHDHRTLLIAWLSEVDLKKPQPQAFLDQVSKCGSVPK